MKLASDLSNITDLCFVLKIKNHNVSIAEFPNYVSWVILARWRHNRFCIGGLKKFRLLKRENWGPMPNSVEDEFAKKLSCNVICSSVIYSFSKRSTKLHHWKSQCRLVVPLEACCETYKLRRFSDRKLSFVHVFVLKNYTDLRNCCCKIIARFSLWGMRFSISK